MTSSKEPSEKGTVKPKRKVPSDRGRLAEVVAAPDVYLREAQAVHALARGDATAEQQILALKWIIEEASGAYRNSYVPDSDRTQFNTGRAFVGQSITRLINTSLTNWSNAK